MAKLKLDGLLNDLGVGSAAASASAPAPAAPSAPALGVSRGFASPPTDPKDAALQEPAPAPTERAAPGMTGTTSDLDALMQGQAFDAAPREEPGATAPTVDAQAAHTPSDRGNGASEAPAGSENLDPDESGGNSGSAAELAQHLLKKGLITQRQVTVAENVIRQSPGERLIDVLVSQGIEEDPLLRALGEFSGLAYETLDLRGGIDHACNHEMLQQLTPEFCKQNKVLPLRVENDRLVIGTSRPDDVFMVDDVRLTLKARSVRIVVVPSADILAALAMLGESQQEEVDVESLLSDIDEDDVQVDRSKQDAVDLEKEAGESPVIRYVNYIIQQAVKEGASDIHIEPGEKALKVRFRIDGVLFESLHPPARMAAAITSRLKIMGNLDISERRLPQDGRIRCQVHGRKLDLRMSTIPTAAGEKVVLRILDTRSINVNLEDLGFDPNTLTIWQHQIDQPHGVILVTGPTGSGKTTTLYASLRSMDKTTQNISTVEDPIEYHLDGITQTQTHEKIGMTFARALKALLRQDPDVIMIGEIRDQETAHTAVQAALTGHLVLSTLHTNDAPSSITRLVNIGIEPFLIGAAINAALAQRLVRKLCSHCKKESTPSEEMREMLEMQGLAEAKFYEPKGCDRCRNIGFSGRVGIYELLAVDDHLRDLIARNPNVTEFRRLCTERGMVSLRQDGFAKVGRGLTTVPEVMRVTESTI